MTRTFYARYHGGKVLDRTRNVDVGHQAGDLCSMEFYDEESARVAFDVAGRGTAAVVVDDLGTVHWPVDTICGFSASRREMEMRPATWRSS